MKRHISKDHSELFEEIMRIKGESEPREKKCVLSVSFSQPEVKDICVEMESTEKVPFAFFDSKPFRQLTAQIFSELNLANVTSRNTMDLVHGNAKQREQI